jgi:hypothetical protein
VQDYIAEMRRMELAPSPTTAVASPAPATGPAPTAPTAATTTPADAPSAPALVAPTSSALVTAPAPSVEDDNQTSVFRRWWFWAGVGALVVATGIVVGVAASGEDRLACPGGAVCP